MGDQIETGHYPELDAGLGENEIDFDRVTPILRSMGMALLAGNILTGARRTQDREDVLQSAFLDLAKLKRAQINDGAHLGNLFLVMVRNKCNDLFRYEGRRPLEFRGEFTDAEQLPSDPGARLLRFDHAQLLEAIDQLDPPLPDMFRDRLRGLTMKEIAEKHRENPGTLASKFKRVVYPKLRNYLENLRREDVL